MEQEVALQMSTAPAPLFEVYGVPISLYGIIAAVLVLFFSYLVWKANRDPKNTFDWIDLVTSTDQATGRSIASIAKIFQLVGGVTSTFIVVKLTLQNAITFDIFGIYLGYVGAINSFEKLLLAKYGVQPQNGLPSGGVPLITPPATQVTVDVTQQGGTPGSEKPPE